MSFDRFYVKSGWLIKQGQGWFASWQRRYFALDSYGRIVYFANDNMFQDPKGEILISSISHIKIRPEVYEHEGTKLSGLILTTDQREWVLAGTESEVVHWMEVIRLVGQGKIQSKADLVAAGVAEPEEEQDVLLAFEIDSDSDQDCGVKVIVEGEGKVKPGQDINSDDLRSAPSALNISGDTFNASNDNISSEEEQEDDDNDGENQDTTNHIRGLRASEMSWMNFRHREMQEKTLIRVINHLIGKQYRVKYLDQVSNGCVAAMMLDSLTKGDINYCDTGKYGGLFEEFRAGKVGSHQDALHLVSDIIDYMAEEVPECKKVLNVQQIVQSGNKKELASFIWCILYCFYITPEVGIEGILEWALNCTADYDHVYIQDLSKSWRDGYAFAALLHCHDESLIDYDVLQPHQNARNLDRVFSKAKDKFNVPVLLNSADVVSDPDEISILLYLASFFISVKQTENQE